MISIIIPTRSRSQYLASALQSCLAAAGGIDCEIIVLDNASVDNTERVVRGFGDSRISYYRSDELLSMRNNFERGFAKSNGSTLCFIGDDDGLFKDSLTRVEEIFRAHDVDAVMSNHARYYWPDTPSNRGGHGLLSRYEGVFVASSRGLLRNLPRHGAYMKVPCMYYGFIKRKVYQNIIDRQGRFFLTNMPDVYSSIALGMENINFAYSNRPFCIAGVSGKSNGGRADSPNARPEYLKEWKKEDDVGFIPGFAHWKTINSVIVEQGIHYIRANGRASLSEVFELDCVEYALAVETAFQLANGASDLDIEKMYSASGITRKRLLRGQRFKYRVRLLTHHLMTLARNMPYSLTNCGVTNVSEASTEMHSRLESGKVRLTDAIPAQIRAALTFLRP